MDPIQINKDLCFDYPDLMREVDQSTKFTLYDVLKACTQSKIPINILSQILQCNYIQDYYKEAISKPFVDKGDIHHLRIYWWGNKNTSCQSWGFDGVGKAGHYGKEMEEHIPEAERATYIENYAIEFSPTYELCGYEIRVDVLDAKYDFHPSITLIELLYAIFWELSFCGSIADRNGKKEEIDKSAKEVDKAIENGTINDITVPFDKVFD